MSFLFVFHSNNRILNIECCYEILALYLSDLWAFLIFKICLESEFEPLFLQHRLILTPEVQKRPKLWLHSPVLHIVCLMGLHVCNKDAVSYIIIIKHSSYYYGISSVVLLSMQFIMKGTVCLKYRTIVFFFVLKWTMIPPEHTVKNYVSAISGTKPESGVKRLGAILL